MSFAKGEMEIDTGNAADELLTTGPATTLQTLPQEELFDIPQELANYQGMSYRNFTGIFQY